jgi:hypothetical protein
VCGWGSDIARSCSQVTQAFLALYFAGVSGSADPWKYSLGKAYILGREIWASLTRARTNLGASELASHSTRA